METTRLCLIRHGETSWNVQRRIQGQTDIPLSAVGIAQARATAASLAAESFAAVLSSDLARARQTAEAIAHALRVPIELRPALRERHYGVLQEHTPEEARLRHPLEYARLEARDVDFVLPGGESLRALAERAMRCVEDAIARFRGRQILIVAHGGVLDVMYRRATGRPLGSPRDFDIPNAALNWLDVRGDAWSVVAWADRAHLTRALDDLPG